MRVATRLAADPDDVLDDPVVVSVEAAPDAVEVDALSCVADAP